MAFSSFENDNDDMLSEINMIPLIDVMLVLLIVFIITVPVMKHAVNVDLPKASNERSQDKPETIRLSVDASGSYFWNAERVEDAELFNRLSQAGAQSPQPELHGGADIGPLAGAGVPVFGLNQDGSRYFDLHHTADDTLDKIDPAQLSQNVAAWAALVWLIADSDVDFRAMRPADAAAH